VKTFTQVIRNRMCAGQSSVQSSPDWRSFKWTFSCAKADYRSTSSASV